MNQLTFREVKDIRTEFPRYYISVGSSEALEFHSIKLSDQFGVGLEYAFSMSDAEICRILEEGGIPLLRTHIEIRECFEL